MIQKQICMLGAYAVGKTSLARRYVESIFDEKYLITIGVKIDTTRVALDDQEVELMLWDIVGVEDRYSVPSTYVRGASGYLLVVDGTRRHTVEVALDLIDQIREDVGELPFVVALNKSNLVEEWEVGDRSWSLSGRVSHSAQQRQNRGRSGGGLRRPHPSTGVAPARNPKGARSVRPRARDRSQFRPGRVRYWSRFRVSCAAGLIDPLPFAPLPVGIVVPDQGSRDLACNHL